MATRGQTHNKRARETALREKRERKQLKKDQRAEGHAVVDGSLPENGFEPEGEEPADAEHAEPVAEASQ